MNRITSSLLAACLSMGTAAAFAQDASSTKSDAKATMSAQDCKDHANTATGQKRTDPATPDSGAGCAMTKTKKHMMKKSSPKTTPDASMSTPAGRTN